MLKISYFDGFTEELVSFDAIFDGRQCDVCFDCFIGEIKSKKFSFPVIETDLDLLIVLEGFLYLDKYYQIQIEDIGSIRCEFEWENMRVERNFDGGSFSCYCESEEHKVQLTKLEYLIYQIREKIVSYAKYGVEL
ncbi:hypothetical protein [Catenovulum sediminis]|uniref:Uncharacterized protein n=1 Tax=Catenovulum sediminis TaxID=1740262 RepID=A0ABV1RF97_9ALTE